MDNTMALSSGAPWWIRAMAPSGRHIIYQSA